MGDVIKLAGDREREDVHRRFQVLDDLGPTSTGHSVAICRGTYPRTGTEVVAVILFAPEGAAQQFAVLAEYLVSDVAHAVCKQIAEAVHRATELMPVLAPEPEVAA